MAGKKKIEEPIPIARTSISIPKDLHREFKRLCFDREVHSNAIVIRLLKTWIEKEKKKTNLALIANG